MMASKTASTPTEPEISTNDEASLFGSNGNEYFELRIPENIVELQQGQTLSEEELNEFDKCQGEIDNFKLEVLRCKLCKYRCIFREEIIHHMKNVHFETERDMSSIATVIDVLMEGLSSEVQKSQHYLDMNSGSHIDNNSDNTEQTLNESDSNIVLPNDGQTIALPDVLSNSQDDEQHFDSSEQVEQKSSGGEAANHVPYQGELETPLGRPKKGVNAVLHSRVDLTAIAKSAAACNPKATRITVFQHLNDSDIPSAIHFRKSSKSDAIIPTRDSLGITSPFLNKDYRGKKHFACTQCHSRYKTETELTNHIQKKHKRGQSVLCEICGLELASQISAKYHAARMHMTKSELFQCNKCDYMTRFEKRLEIHRAKHQSEFYCEACKKSYVSQQKLDKHYQSPMHKHIINPLICEHCGYSSNKKDNFLVHMRKHTGERPYKCNHCPYASADGSTLKKHVMAKHSNIRPFKCQWCTFSSVDKKGLTIHLRKHTGERPFRCNHCSYAAKRRSALKVHMQTHVQSSEKKVTENDDPIKILNKLQSTEGTITTHSDDSNLQSLQVVHNQIPDSQQQSILPHTSQNTVPENQAHNSGVMQNQVGIIQMPASRTPVQQNQGAQSAILQQQRRILPKPQHETSRFTQQVTDTTPMVTNAEQETEQSVRSMWQNM
ncbi:zinc finger protein 41-like [Anneissia japonica]|uniref:zinc finger protein 41-like n=1 Tax=Anneissia japonica TaxID=1529436 RepID=UPI001425A410|nr:zinc finger protein 41-like [Anneissia japonica]